MAVIERAAKKKNSDKFGLFVFLFLVIGIPYLLIRTCTGSSKKKEAQQTQTPAVASVQAETDDAAETAAAQATTEETTTATAGQDEAQSDNGYRSASAYSRQYLKDANGLYRLTGPVVDTAHVLSESEYNELDSYLRNLDTTTGVQIAVLTVDTLDGDDINSFSMKYAEAWKLGQKGVDNGALLTVAMQEHDVRIETGYGTEGALTDAKCARIIRNVLIPAFRSNKYGEGIISAVKNMAGIITNDSSLVTVNQTDEEKESSGNSVGNGIAILLFVLFVLFWLVLIIVSSVMSAVNPHSGIGRNYTSNTGTHFGGFGGGSGGGGFSGGGGGFGGGGASGHW